MREYQEKSVFFAEKTGEMTNKLLLLQTIKK